MVRFRQSLLALGFFLFISSTSALMCHAGSVQYSYDSLGRLSSVGDGSANYTVYDYDETGNLLSISTATTSANPPVIQSINPDVLFIGSTTPVSITGQNLLTTKEIIADQPLVYTKILKATETEVKAEVYVAATVLPASVNLTLTTFHGSGVIPASLAASKLSFGPSLLTLSPGTGGAVQASIYPALSRNITLQIKSSDSSIVSAPQSVVIPAGTTASFSVSALRTGTATVGSGEQKATVLVTSDVFTPLAGEALTNVTRPVSVYMENPATDAFTAGPLVSVDVGESGSITQMSAPLCIAIDQSAGNAIQPSPPVSVNIEQSYDSTQPALPVSVVIDQSNSAAQTSSPLSVSIDTIQGNTTLSSAPVSAKISPP